MIEAYPLTQRCFRRLRAFLGTPVPVSACSRDLTGPPSPAFSYAVAFADGTTHEAAETRGEFVVYDLDPGPGTDRVATHQSGDGITIDEFLPGTEACPTPRTMVVTAGALHGSARADVRRTGVLSKRARSVSRLIAATSLLLLGACAVPARRSPTAEFPHAPESLHGGRILAIVVSQTDPDRAYFIAGTATWTGATLEVRVHPDSTPVVLRGPRGALEGFDPALLPRLVQPNALPAVRELSRGAVAGVAVLGPDLPPGALMLVRPFFGLATSRTGEVLLLQGDP